MKERRKIRFFNSLHKRGLNPDKVSDYKTNVKYTQIQKTISNYQKSENQFINKIVKDFEEVSKEIDQASGVVAINKKLASLSVQESLKTDAPKVSHLF